MQSHDETVQTTNIVLFTPPHEYENTLKNIITFTIVKILYNTAIFISTEIVYSPVISLYPYNIIWVKVQMLQRFHCISVLQRENETIYTK